MVGYFYSNSQAARLMAFASVLLPADRRDSVLDPAYSKAVRGAGSARCTAPEPPQVAFATNRG